MEEKNAYRKNVIHFKKGDRTGCNRIFSWENNYTLDIEKATCKVCVYRMTGFKLAPIVIIKKYSTIQERVLARIAGLESTLELNKKLLESYKGE